MPIPVIPSSIKFGESVALVRSCSISMSPGEFMTVELSLIIPPNADISTLFRPDVAEKIQQQQQEQLRAITFED